MDRFLTRNRTRSNSVSKEMPETTRAHKAKMADAESSSPRRGSSSPHVPAISDIDYEKIAAAVAKLIQPTIASTVEQALAKALHDVHQELKEHSKTIEEAEQRLGNVEDEMTAILTRLTALEQLTKEQAEKIDDLENRSRRNNLRIVGLPESYPQHALKDLCQRTIPSLLGLNRNCTIERAHRLGIPHPDQKVPRQTIVKYLHYPDKTEILARFKGKKRLTFEGHNLLLFADYSVEVTRKRKLFSPICTTLFEKHVRFSLAYPAVLRFTSKEGRQLTFKDPEDAKHYWDTLTEDDRRQIVQIQGGRRGSTSQSREQDGFNHKKGRGR